MNQLTLTFPRRYVDVHYIAAAINPKTGAPYEWTHQCEAHLAPAHIREVNAGRMLDPFGEPWGDVRAEVAA